MGLSATDAAPTMGVHEWVANVRRIGASMLYGTPEQKQQANDRVIKYVLMCSDKTPLQDACMLAINVLEHLAPAMRTRAPCIACVSHDGDTAFMHGYFHNIIEQYTYLYHEHTGVRAILDLLVERRDELVFEQEAGGPKTRIGELIVAITSFAESVPMPNEPPNDGSLLSNMGVVVERVKGAGARGHVSAKMVRRIVALYAMIQKVVSEWTAGAPLHIPAARREKPIDDEGLSPPPPLAGCVDGRLNGHMLAAFLYCMSSL